MGFRFRRSVKIMPGVRLNIGKKGIGSVTVGKRGASVNIGKKGTHANVGIPGTGLSYRTKMFESNGSGRQASKVNQLEKLERLRRNGSIGEEEYFRLRNDIMGYVPEKPKKGCLNQIATLIFWLIVLAIVLVAVVMFSESKLKDEDEAPAVQPGRTSVPVERSNREQKSDFQKLSPEKQKESNEKLNNLF